VLGRPRRSLSCGGRVIAFWHGPVAGCQARRIVYDSRVPTSIQKLIHLGREAKTKDYSKGTKEANKYSWHESFLFGGGCCIRNKPREDIIMVES